jgi:hypothetical protein
MTTYSRALHAGDAPGREAAQLVEADAEVEDGERQGHAVDQRHGQQHRPRGAGQAHGLAVGLLAAQGVGLEAGLAVLDGDAGGGGPLGVPRGEGGLDLGFHGAEAVDQVVEGLVGHAGSMARVATCPHLTASRSVGGEGAEG